MTNLLLSSGLPDIFWLLVAVIVAEIVIIIYIICHNARRRKAKQDDDIDGQPRKKPRFWGNVFLSYPLRCLFI